MAHDPAKFSEGSAVRIVPLKQLEEFMRTWQLHNKLQSNQLPFAGQTAKIKRSYMYHGGDILYELDEIPGIWHEQCLESPS